MLLFPLACHLKTEDIISDPLNHESMSVGTPKHLATSVSYVEPILGMKSCASAFMLRIVIL